MYLILLHVPCPHLLNSYLCKTFGAVTQRPRPRTRPATSGGRYLGDPHIRALPLRAVLNSARTVIWDIRFYKPFAGRELAGLGAGFMNGLERGPA